MTATLDYGISGALLSEHAVSAPTSPRSHFQRALLTDPPSRTFDVRLSQLTMTIRLTGEEPGWLYRTMEAMQRLSRLPANWSSYGSRQIEDVAIISAARMLAKLLGPQGFAPTVMPTLHGGVQLEWHRSGSDVEIELSAEGTISYIYAYDRQRDVTWETDEVTPETLHRVQTTISRLAQH